MHQAAREVEKMFQRNNSVLEPLLPIGTLPASSFRRVHGLLHSQHCHHRLANSRKKPTVCSFIMQAWKALVQVSKYQIYVSRSLDPFLNLSIEHYLLQKSPPSSTVLFLYVNKPCIVIGRNQNPWLEVDLHLLKQARASANNTRQVDGKVLKAPWQNVVLVRRRSGGGTVFHDEGNVNYSVICPTANFTRDKHAEMVTMAIREVNLRARVNERHDIVLDQGSILEENDWPDTADMHRTIFHPSSENSPPLKVSGSAYKMTRQRSLHHGTCLLASADLPGISQYLRSPARPFIKARGVESVRSPIGNVHKESKTSSANFNKSFQIEVMRTFVDLYGIKSSPSMFDLSQLYANEEIRSGGDDEWAAGCIGKDFDNVDEVQEGIKELQVSSQKSYAGLSSCDMNLVVQMAL